MNAVEATKAGITDLDERKRHVQLVATKGNHLPPVAFVPVWLRRGQHGALFTADVSFDRSIQPTISNIERNANDVLVELCKTRTPTLGQWRDECVRRGIIRDGTNEGKRKAMQRIVAKLRESGLVEPGTSRGIYLPVLTEGH